MNELSVEHVAFETGDMVLAGCADAVVMIGHATEPGSEHLPAVLSAIANGQVDRIRELVIRVCQDPGCTSAGALVRSGSSWLLVTTGDLRVSVQSTTARVIVDALPGQLDQRLFDDVEQVSFYPNHASPLERNAASDLSGDAARAGRATVTMAAAPTLTPAEPDPVAPAKLVTSALDSPQPSTAAASSAGATQLEGVRFVDFSVAPEPRVALGVGVDSHGQSTQASVEVHGIRCPVDHHNHPKAVYCAHCGRRLGVHHTAVPVPGPRPPLGLLLMDDGSTYSLVSDVIVGRDPGVHADVINNGVDSLQIGGDAAAMSRAHVGIYLQGWDVTAVDLGSVNGTTVRRGSGEVVQVPRDQRMMLGAGDTLLLGEREIRVELHHIGSW